MNKKKCINKERKVEEMDDEVEGSINKKRKVEETMDACMTLQASGSSRIE